MPTPLELVRSLNSTLCPSCGRAKKASKTLCGGCYFTLPQDLRDALYCRLGEGYEEAVDAALLRLGVRTPHLPSN
jgi:predicted amidophosphoribosyltransferase